MKLVDQLYDVIVLGGGNAGICAAISACESGAKVLLVEHAGKALRGGNSRHTRNLRAMHDKPTYYLSDSYLEEEFWNDLLRVTEGATDERLARLVMRGTADALPWMARHGVKFQSSLSGTLSLSRTNLFFLGGGKALLNAYYASAEAMGVDVLYEAQVEAIELDGNEVRWIDLRIEEERRRLEAKAFVVATGGFQANIEWMKEYWGDAADNFIIRGTPYATGHVLRYLLDQGAASSGDPQQCHAVAVDARAPKFDGGIVTRLDCVPFGIVVNREAKRFYDEGEDFWPKRYAIWGSLIARQPDQIAYVIFDAKAENLFMPSLFHSVEARTIAELSDKLDLDRSALAETVANYNAAVRLRPIDPQVLDGSHTENLDPPKSNWAQTIDKPPFRAYPLRPGITFTYLGLKVDEEARVILESGRPVKNLFASGEIMAGNILGRGYLAGFGMSIGTVFGRIAGRGGAAHASK